MIGADHGTAQDTSENRPARCLEHNNDHHHHHHEKEDDYDDNNDDDDEDKDKGSDGRWVFNLCSLVCFLISFKTNLEEEYRRAYRRQHSLEAAFVPSGSVRMRYKRKSCGIG